MQKAHKQIIRLAALLFCLCATIGTQAQSWKQRIDDTDQAFMHMMQTGDTTGLYRLTATYQACCRDLVEKDMPDTSSSDPTAWKALMQLSQLYAATGNKALEKLHKQANDYYSRSGSADHLYLFGIEESYYMYSMGHRYYFSALAAAEKMTELAQAAADTTLVSAVTLGYQANVYMAQGNIDEAERWTEKAYASGQGKITADTNDFLFQRYVEIVMMRARISHLRKKSGLAETCVDEALHYVADRYTTSSVFYVNGLLQKADLFVSLGKQEEAKAIVAEAGQLLSKLTDADATWTSQTQMVLANARRQLGIDADVTDAPSDAGNGYILFAQIQQAANANDYETTIRLGRLWMEQAEAQPAPNIGSYYTVMDWVFAAYLAKQQYHEAMAMLDHGADFLASHKITNPDNLFPLYLTYSRLYDELMDYSKAFDYALKAKHQMELSGMQDDGYVATLSWMAFVAYMNQDLAYAKLLADEASHIIKTNRNALTEHTINEAIGRLGFINGMLGYNKEAKEQLEQKLKSLVQNRDNDKEWIATIVALLPIYMNTGDYVALRAAFDSIESRTKANGAYDFTAPAALFHVAEHNPKAITLAAQYNAFEQKKAANVFASFSEQERMNYWARQANMMNLINNAVLWQFPHEDKATTQAFDNALFVKNMLNNSTHLLRHIVEQSGDDRLRNDYACVTAMKRLLLHRSLHADSAAAYRQRVADLERSIVSRIDNFSQLLEQQTKNLAEVKAMLKRNDVAIEFVIMERPVANNMMDSERSYGALVMRDSYDSPKLVELCPTKQLSTTFMDIIHTDTAFINAMYSMEQSPFYQLVWQKIDQLLKPGDNVYFAPTSFLNRINFGALSNGQQRLSQRYNMVQLSSTAYIAKYRKNKNTGYRDAVVYGGIRYNVSDSEMTAQAMPYELKADTHSYFAQRSGGNRGATQMLSGTLKEALAITELLKKKGIKTRMLQGSQANEESFKAMSGSSPELLHIGTHGFFLNNTDDIHNHSTFLNTMRSDERQPSPLNYSGLLMAGAAKVWNGGTPPDGVEDGVLTSAEIAQLDLSNIKLAVLSACETGVGFSDDNMGEFGLKRGLKNAGVQTIVTSLWEVPDEATSLLMTTFFHHLLSGEDTAKALATAQETVKKQYPQPYYWAAFVIED